MTTDEKLTPVAYRSVSQIKQYDECGWQYYLARRMRAWKKPAAWLPQGIAGHAVIEYDLKEGFTCLEDAQDYFTEKYAESVAELTEITPNFQYWQGSGPRYPGPIDVERRHGIGRDQVARWWDFTEANPGYAADKIDGVPMVEYPFSVHFGDVEVQGLIDHVHQGIPVDAKFGNRNGDVFQLVTYSFVLHVLFGIPVTGGAFWYGKNGKLVRHDYQSDWTLEQITDLYGRADEGIKEEDFTPNPSKSKCMFCPVERACEWSQA